MSGRRIVGFPLCLAMLLGMAACKQSEGARCEIESDCTSGLTCVVSAGTGDGTCQDNNKPRPMVDSAVDAVVIRADASNDAPVGIDAAGGSPSTDAAQSDGPAAAPTVDAAVDARVVVPVSDGATDGG